MPPRSLEAYCNILQPLKAMASRFFSECLSAIGAIRYFRLHMYMPCTYICFYVCTYRQCTFIHFVIIFCSPCYWTLFSHDTVGRQQCPLFFLFNPYYLSCFGLLGGTRLQCKSCSDIDSRAELVSQQDTCGVRQVPAKDDDSDRSGFAMMMMMMMIWGGRRRWR